MHHTSCRRLAALVAVAALGSVTACGGGDGTSAAPATPTPKTARKIVVTSPAFTDGGTVPRRYTCDGENVSPPLDLSHVPTATAELILLAQDPDASHGTFTHWIMWGITPDETELNAGEAPRGAVQGRNGFGHRGYGGPCPPHGKRHRYVFSVFATDKKLNLPAGASAVKA